MTLPFTREQFFAVFAAYNRAVWPAQVALLALAVAIVLLVAAARPAAGRLISAALALLWAWVGAAYHATFFASINPIAPWFAALSFAGALAFVWHGVVRGRLAWRVRRDACSVAGAALVLYALVVYPAWTVLAGHAYPAMPTFGLPCPTTLFTVGVLAFLVRPYPRAVVVVPLLWCLVGVQAAFLLGVWADLGLLAAAGLAAVLLAQARAAPSSAARARP